MLGGASGHKVSSSVVNALLDAGMDSEVARIGDNGGFSPLHYLAICDDSDSEAILAMAMLHKKIPELFSGTGNTVGWTPLHCAVMHGRSGMAKRLATLGGKSAVLARISKVSRFPGYSCLHLIALKGDTAGEPMLHKANEKVASMQIVGLVKGQIYNGRECFVVKKLANGRFEVLLKGDEKELSVRGENLMRLEEIRRLDMAAAMARDLCRIGGRELILLPNAQGDTAAEFADKEENVDMDRLLRSLLPMPGEVGCTAESREHGKIASAAPVSPVLGCLMRICNLDSAHNNRPVRILAHQADGRFLVVEDAMALGNQKRMSFTSFNVAHLSSNSTPLAVEAVNLAPWQMLSFDGPPGFNFSLECSRLESTHSEWSANGAVVLMRTLDPAEIAAKAVAMTARQYGLEEKHFVVADPLNTEDKTVLEVILSGKVVVAKREPSHLFQNGEIRVNAAAAAAASWVEGRFMHG